MRHKLDYVDRPRNAILPFLEHNQKYSVLRHEIRAGLATTWCASTVLQPWAKQTQLQHPRLTPRFVQEFDSIDQASIRSCHGKSQSGRGRKVYIR